MNVAGGSPAHSYAWDLAGSVIANTEDISNLLSGSYLFTATDANGCQTTLPVLINQPSNPFIINTTATDASCAMSSDEVSRSWFRRNFTIGLPCYPTPIREVGASQALILEHSL